MSGLVDVTAEAEYSMNFTESENIFDLCLHYYENIIFCMKMDLKDQFISNIFEMKSYSLCLGNFSKILQSIT